MTKNKKKTHAFPYVLIVDDSDEDFEIAKRSLQKAGIDWAIRRCADGPEALALLEGHQGKKDMPKTLPAFILLDLNLPGMSGDKILKRIKDNNKIKQTPVVMCSSSNNRQDIDACYLAGANCYVRKPATPEGYLKMAKALKNFWCEWVTYSESD